MDDKTRPQPTYRPPHPLVVDHVTRLCRYATQADVHRLEAINVLYDSLIRDAREMVAKAERFMERVNVD